MKQLAAGVVVAGGGQAAGELAFRLRLTGYDERITIVGAEAHLPYQRPPLSKGFLSGLVSSDDLLLRSEAAYAKARIDFVRSTTVTCLETGAHRVRLSDGRVLPYDKLVLATGGHARRLACPGADLAGVHVLRTLDDVLAMQSDFRPSARLVIVGGGYIGLEVAAVSVKAGLSVTLVEAASRLLARVTGEEVSAFYERVHRGAGVDVHTSANLVALRPASAAPERVGSVVLADGRTFPADLVLAGIGLVPNTQLAEQAGLPTGNGILVDEFCRTSDLDVLAIGDCANHPNPLLGRRIRLESVANAIEQARVAADTIGGNLKPYAAIPRFWSDQYDLKLQAVGLPEGHDSTVLRGDMADRAFTLFYLRQGIVIAVDLVNRAADLIASRKLIGLDVRANLSALADLSHPLKAIVAEVVP